MTALNNLNYFSSNKAVLTIEKIPNVSILAQNFNIPSITIGEAIQPMPITDIQRPGDKIQFDDLAVEFILDENIEAWLEIQRWMLSLVGLGQKYDITNTVSDGKIVLLSSHNQKIATMSFKDLWPTSLTSIDITQEDSETVYKKVTVTFKFTLYTVE